MAGKLDRYTIVIDGDNKKLELAAKKTVGDLGKLGKAANDTNGGVSKLATGVRNASTNVAAFQGPLGGVSGRLGSLATLLTNVNPLMVALGLGVGGVSFFMVSAIKEFDQFNLRNKKTEALLKATGSASGFTAHQLDLMAKAVALNTLASVEGIKDTQNVLLTFKGISKDVFSSAIELSQDMAAVMGTDSKAAALQLGKALESPTQGISQLKKSGVSFSQAQRTMIRDMENAGRVVDAQTYILETLKNQIGGTGAAEGDGTVVGAIDSMSQHWQEMKINVADSSGAAAAAAAFFNVISDGLAKVNQDLWPDDDRRMQELAAQRMELKSELATLSSGSRTSILSYIVGPESEWYNVQRSLGGIAKEMREIQDRRKTQILEEQKANEAADKNNEEREKEKLAQKKLAEAKKLKVVYAKNAAAIAAMDMQFATEDEKVGLNLKKNLDRIDGWQVSEQELKVRGFESMTELQQSYRDMAYEQFDNDLSKIEQRQADSEAKKTAKIEQEAKKRAQAEKAISKAAYSAVMQSNAQFLGALEGSGQKRTALYKAMFLAQKAAAIPGMIASTEEGATAALKLGPIAGPPAAMGVRALGYASVGLVAGQTIAGAFEEGGIVGGSSFSGDNLTAFVNSSEMILNVGQQKELFDIANGMGAGGGGSGTTINIIEDASKAGTVESSKGLNEEDVENIFVSNIQQGRSIDELLQQTYRLSRGGS